MTHPDLVVVFHTISWKTLITDSNFNTMLLLLCDCNYRMLMLEGTYTSCVCVCVCRAVPLCSWRPLSACAGPRCRAGSPPFSVCTSQTLLKPDGHKTSQQQQRHIISQRHAKFMQTLLHCMESSWVKSIQGRGRVSLQFANISTKHDHSKQVPHGAQQQSVTCLFMCSWSSTDSSRLASRRLRSASSAILLLYCMILSLVSVTMCWT